MKAQVKKWMTRLTWLVAVVAVVTAAWLKYSAQDKNAGLVSGNGRIEAVEIDISAKTPGRVKEIFVREGDAVTAGQLVAQMDTEVLEAQLHQAEAQLRQAESAVLIARSQVLLKIAERAASLAMLAQREAEHDIADTRLGRSSLLAKEGASSQQEADDDSARVKATESALTAVRAQIAAADAAIATSRAQVSGAESAVEAARASIERIRADIKDSALRAPRNGRVQYRVAQSGEVVAAGGRVLNMVDLNDVYMTFFLPTTAVGKIALGSEVLLVLDAAPRHVIPASVSFVADVAQFTPKTVETAVEREKLMFRVRANISPELLKKYTRQVKTGLPGVAYVKLDSKTPWPAHLQANIVQ